MMGRMAGTGGGARRATGTALLLVSLALAGCTAEPPSGEDPPTTSDSIALRVRTVHVANSGLIAPFGSTIALSMNSTFPRSAPARSGPPACPTPHNR